jgi:hypothetical protein
MATVKRHRLIEIDWPRFDQPPRPPVAPAEEYRRRIDEARAAMEARGLTHLVVYGDREHFANLAYLTNFDPRYEEALLVVGRDRAPLAIVGNECENYLPISPLWQAGWLRKEVHQSLSLPDQPRERSRPLEEILRDEGIGAGALAGCKVGCVGWKTFAPGEHRQGERAIELPAFIVDTLRELCGPAAVVNATDLFIRADGGLRARATVWEIALCEWANGLASEGVRRILFGLQEGKRDDEMAALAGYDGVPLGAHMTVRTGATMISLSSPSGNVVRRGNRFSCSLCYRGANVCRAGWVAASADDLPPGARDYLPAFAGVYFEVMARWYRLLEIGTPGARFAEVIDEGLPGFGVYLNPGHLTHLDEWLSSPFYRGSQIPLRSGMIVQSDVIPSSKIFYSSRMEEGLVLADGDLRRDLAAHVPDLLARCQARRRFMVDVLGFELSESVLPLSNIPGLVPPFLLQPRQVLALEA